MRKLDITGQKFNLLIAISPTEERRHGQVVWIFQCQCGNIHKSLPSPVKHGKIKSCGCLDTSRHTENIINKKFHMLLAIKPTDKRIGGSIVWLFQCDCGKKVEKDISLVKCGDTKSCGCYNQEIRIQTLNKYREYNKIQRRERCKNSPLRDINKRGLMENNDWQKSIYKKYNYTCDKCKKNHCKICAHHLNSWDSFVEERFDINNGVCLCQDCHIEFHKKYGYGKNTKSQYEEFKS